MNKPILEIIAFTLESCKIIEHAGAHRVELCDNPGDGGTTPSYGFMKLARQMTSLPIFPIIRPRGGNFVYSNAEFEEMLSDIEIARQLNLDGIVTGMLTRNGEVDLAKCKLLVEAAAGLPCTFHRAFDRTQDKQVSLDQVIECGFSRILTSGGFPIAEDGVENLKEIIELADEKIIIMPGSGIRSSNISKIKERTGAREFHSSARILTRDSNVYNPPEMSELTGEISTDEKEIEMMLHELN